MKTKCILALFGIVIIAILILFTMNSNKVVLTSIEQPDISGKTMVKKQDVSEKQADIPKNTVKNDDSLSAFEPKKLEELMPETFIVEPKKHNLSFKQPVKKLNEEERQIAKDLVNGIKSYMESVKTLDFDLSMRDTYYPMFDMEGHISSNKIDTFTFKGKALGNTLDAHIDGTKEFAVISMEGDEGPAEREHLAVFEFLQNIWMTPLRKMEAINLFDSIVQMPYGSEETKVASTVLSGPEFRWVFESSTGRLLQVESQHSQQKSVTKLVYDKESRYPQKIILHFTDDDTDPDNDRVITFENNNIQITFKEKREKND